MEYPAGSRNNTFPSISRSEIKGDDDALVALFSSRISGVEFLQENNAWGFVNLNREPSYVGIYLGGEVQEILYFGKVNDIVQAEDASLTKPPEQYDRFESGRKVIHFVPEELFELEDPIPYESHPITPPVDYTELVKFKNAESTSDLF